MALTALLVRPCFLAGFRQFLMAGLAVFVIGVLEFQDLTLFLKWVVALLAVFYWIAFLPHIFAILVIMVAFSAGESIIVMVFFVAEIDGALFVSFISSILDTHSIGALIGRTQHSHNQEKETNEQNNQKPKTFFPHPLSHLLSLQIIPKYWSINLVPIYYATIVKRVTNCQGLSPHSKGSSSMTLAISRNTFRDSMASASSILWMAKPA